MIPKSEIIFYCASCGQKIAVDEAGAGRLIKCPGCNRQIKVPIRAGSAKPTVKISVPKANGPVPGGTKRVEVPPSPENDSRGLLVGGAVCLALGICFAFVQRGALFLCVSLFFASFIIALFCLWKRMITGGAFLLAASLLAGQQMLTPELRAQMEQFMVVQAKGEPIPAQSRAKQLTFDENGRARLVDAPPPVARRAESPAEKLPARQKAPLPFYVYNGCENIFSFIASGWMGFIEAIEFDDCWSDNPQSGKTCIRFTYNETYDWGGIAWQNPPNNWGDDPFGGCDLSGARQLKFWARSEENGTMAEFKVGLRDSGKYADTVHASTGKIKLSTTWKEHIIRLDGQNLSRVVNGFVCVIEGAATPQTVYIDEIVFQ